ncbi:MAG: hypothetical protein ACRDQ0_07070 [Pseudonocardia sp.]
MSRESDGETVRTAPFTSPFMYWLAIDFTTSDPDELARINRFYDEVHIPEVFAANPGFVAVHRYTLQIQDRRGDFGAGNLIAYEIESAQAAEEYLEREPASSYSADPPVWPERLDTRWRVLYRRVAQTAPSTVAPGAISLIGINPPPDVDAAELAEFDRFYSDVHLPENTELGSFSRGVRFEVRHALKHPAPGCPRFLAIYELEDGSDESTRATLEHLKDKDDAYTKGPSAWIRKSTPWRLWYRRVASHTRAEALQRPAARRAR